MDQDELRMENIKLEYSKLKDEQKARIGFRDNLLYVTLIALSGIFSYSMKNPAHYYAFFACPWICFILGWTYIVNDEKISSIGGYIRNELAKRIKNLSKDEAFGWEIHHRADKYRVRRKVFQFIVDECTFCFSGLFFLIFFVFLESDIAWYLWLVWIVEFIGTCILGVEIYRYADFKKEEDN